MALKTGPAKVSIIILNYNGLTKLGELFFKNAESVLNLDYPNYEVIYVDNGSTDESIEWLVRVYGEDRLKMVRLERNYGYTGGNNSGALHTSEDSGYLVFLNNDTIIDKSMLKELIKVMESDRKIAIAQPKVLNMDGSLQWARLLYIPITNLFINDRSRINEAILTSMAFGMALAVKRDVFNILGGFDENFYLLIDEIDLCFRALFNGYKIVYIPTSIVYHKGGGTLGFNPIVSFYYERNWLWVAAKIYSANYLILYVFYRLLDISKFLLGNAMKANRQSTMWEIMRMRGFLCALIHLRNALRKRVKLSKHIADSLEIFLKSFLPLSLLYLTPRFIRKRLIERKRDSIVVTNEKFLSKMHSE